MIERSQAALLLARTGKTQEQIAKDVTAKLPRGKKVSRVAVLKWQSGAAKPDDEKRAILEQLYGVPRKAWNEKPAAARSQTSADDIPSGALAKADALERRVHALMSEVGDDEGSTPVEKSRVYQSCATTLGIVIRMRGEMPMTKQKFFATDDWRRIVETLELALKPFPAAALAAAKALRQLDAEAADL